MKTNEEINKEINPFIYNGKDICYKSSPVFENVEDETSALKVIAHLNTAYKLGYRDGTSRKEELKKQIKEIDQIKERLNLLDQQHKEIMETKEFYIKELERTKKEC